MADLNIFVRELRHGLPNLPAPVADPSGMQVLTAADFTYLGTFRVPIECGITPEQLAGRTDGGVLKLYLGNTGRGTWCEFSPPATLGTGTNWDAAPRATALRSWSVGTDHILFCPRDPYVPGVYYHGSQVGATPTPMGAFWADGALWGMYGEAYNALGLPDPHLIRMDIDGGGVMTVSGPWRIGQVLRSESYYIRLPAYLSAPAGGALWANGCMGIRSGNAGSSWGPTLRTFLGNLPSPSTPIGDYITSYNATLADFNYTHLCPRPGDHTQWHGTAERPVWPIGYWTQIDCSQSGTACYIETPTKWGMWFGGFLGGGCVWYSSDYNGDGKIDCYDACGPTWQLPEGHGQVWDDTATGTTGPHAGYTYPYWWIYDPTQMARVARGEILGWDIRPAAEFNPATTLPGGHSPAKYQVHRGSYYDPVAQRLYVVSPAGEMPVQAPYNYLPVINVYQVA